MLCRVNKMCQLVFTPVLYRHITLTGRLRGPMFFSLPMMRFLAESPHVAHTQTLMLDSCEGLEALHHENACRLLQCLPSLRRFHWLGEPLEASIVAALVGSCSHLSAVEIQFPVYNIDVVDAEAGSGGRVASGGQSSYGVDLEGVVRHLGNLASLKELCLDHMYGNPEQWIAPISRILIASPGLEKLQLSFSPQAVYFHLVGREADLTPFKTFLLRISTLFKASGASPLRLRSFRCGSGVHPDFPPDSPVAITDLICLDDLATVYLNTGFGLPRVIPTTLPVAGMDRHIAIADFLHNTPRLRRFSVSRYDALVHNALLSLDPARAKTLAVTWDVLPSWEWPGPGILVKTWALPQYHFRMLKIEFRGFMQFNQSHNNMVRTEAEHLLEGLVEGDDGTLEGLDVVLPVHGRQQYVDFLAIRIPGLKGLTQMNLGHGNLENPAFVNLDFWTVAAMKLALAGERLRYIGTGLAFLEVVRGEEGTMPDLINIGVREEVDDVELFALRRGTPDFVFPDREYV